MSNSGTVFRNGPVVCLIVDNLSLVDKVNILKQIEEEDEKRPPGSTNPMSGWKEAIEKDLNDQRVISTSTIIARDEYNQAELNHICFTHLCFSDDKVIIPDQWLAKEEKFERLLLLCPNLTGIHFIMRESVKFANILDIILRLAPKLTSFTFIYNGHHVKGDNEHRELLNEKLVEIFRNRKGKMEYIDVTTYRLSDAHVREWIEANPNLTAIQTNTINVDFVKKYLYLEAMILRDWTRINRIVELCEFFKAINSHYKKSSSNGLKLSAIACVGDIAEFTLEEIVDSFREIEFLCVPSELHIRRLQVMKNLKVLSLTAGENDDTQAVSELLPHLGNLSELHIHLSIISESTLCQLHILCPHLRRVTITDFDEDDEYEELSLPILKGICKLAELEYFEYQNPGDGYKWANRNAIEKKRLEFNVELP